MSSTEKKLAQSLTAESVELIPYLPYLLQDLWELLTWGRSLCEVAI